MVMNEKRNRWSVLWRKTVLSCRRSVCGNTLLLVLGLLIGIGQVQAQTANCYLSRELQPDSPWQMAPSGTSFRNGDIVGQVPVSVIFTMPNRIFDTTVVIAQGIVPNNPYQAVPLNGMPGLGLIVRWMGYYGTVGLEMLGTPVAPGTIISKQARLPVMRARGSSGYMVIQMYRFELVVIDEKVYKGGELTFAERNQIYVTTAQANGLGMPQMCLDGWVDVMEALTKTVQVPELPKPVLPTCKFSTGTLNQRVPLSPVDSGQIAPAGSARSLGGEGQNTFRISATGCGKDAKLDIYFTDTRDNATAKDYIRTTNPAVGIRMFYQSESNPVPLGPAPSGSWVPSRRAVSLGPASAEGTSLSARFTAQYVRLPNKTEADIKPGPLEAAATFVIVYP